MQSYDLVGYWGVATPQSPRERLVTVTNLAAQMMEQESIGQLVWAKSQIDQQGVGEQFEQSCWPDE